MSVVIFIHGLARGGGPSGYVVSYTPDGHDGRGDLVIAQQEAYARRFADAEEATNCWQAQSKTHPLRPDGKPNRPLTAFTVQIYGVDT